MLRAFDAGRRGMAMGIFGFGFGVALTLSFALMTTASPGTLPWVPMRWAAVGRIGLGFVLPSLTLGALPGLGGNPQPQAASAIGFPRQLGGAAGVGLVGLFLQWRLRMRAPQRSATAAP